MKLINKYMAPALLIASMAMTSCYDTVLEYTGDVGTVNRGDGTSSSTGTLATVDEAVGFLRTAQMRVIDAREHKYQFQKNFIADEHAGYMSCPHNFEGRWPSSLTFYSNFVSGPEANLQWVAQQTVPVMRSMDTLSIQPLSAFAQVLLADVSLQYTNVHGPMAYKDYKKLKEDRPLEYLKQSEVYTCLFQDLVRADSILEVYQQAPDTKLDEAIVATDMVSGVEDKDAAKIVSSWRKYANSLILRMAMTAVNVEGYTCDINGVAKTVQQLGEEAVQRGVLTAEDNPIALVCGSGTDVGYHPLYKIANIWVDTRLNASYHNYLVRTQHPILDFWFAKNQGDITNMAGKVCKKESAYLSLRSGMLLQTAAMTSQTYQYYSKFNLNFAGERLALFKVEEALFLQAEADLRGWNVGGKAEDFYNAGIKYFFTSHALGGQYDEYMKWRGMGDRTIDPNLYQGAVYEDFMDSDNSLPVWDGYYKLNNSYGLPENADNNPYVDAQNKEQLLQKIITQKWIALFPMSDVAWTDYRRTGYPQLLPYCPFAYGDSDGSLVEPKFNWSTGEILDEGVTIRRIPYNTGDKEIAAEVKATAQPALNAEATGLSRDDKQGTRLWWDVADRKKLN